MRKILILMFLLSSAAYSHHMFDVLGGSGLVWASTSSDSSFLSSNKVQAGTADSVFMRESIFLGLRYSNYSPAGDAFFVFGFEASGTAARPTTDGQMKYSLLDSGNKTISSYKQDLDSATAPAFNSLRGSVHIGLNTPIGRHFAWEFGILGGLSAGQSKADYRYVFSNTSGSSSGPEGIGVHAALRLALQFNPTESVVIGTEYRLFGELFGSIALIPGLYSSSSSLSNSGHLFLLSAGYRFGMAAPSAVAGPEKPAMAP